ncbi:hypothetical protein ACVWXM_005451 [Bradyrhizobium sp. GM7.3]
MKSKVVVYASILGLTAISGTHAQSPGTLFPLTVAKSKCHENSESKYS